MSFFEKTKAILFNSDFSDSAGVKDIKLEVRGKDTESLLKELIRNTKITNLHLEQITGDKFTEQDLED